MQICSIWANFAPEFVVLCGAVSPFLILNSNMNILETIHSWLTPLLGEEHFAVDVQYIPRKPTAKLLIILDGDKGVGIDKCAEVSRALSEQIDEADLIPNAYTLEVSSPGVDKPLVLPRQYPQHVNRTLQVDLIEGEVASIQGKLTAVTPEGIQLETTKKKTTLTHDIPFTNIKKAVVLILF